ncbi:MAG: selenium binding protein [Monoraphidium minutum]|nr:MAG: selenium binding protein [Monoraphidium minutum]
MPTACCAKGPGYATPLEAKEQGPRERVLLVPCIVPDASRPDYLATVDVDPESDTYGQVVARLPTAAGDELHHTGWNACSSCHGDATRERRFLILPALGSGRIYAVDVQDPRSPKLHKVVESSTIAAATGGLAYPHTSHCLADGTILVSHLGDAASGDGRGNFVLLDSASLEVVGTWAATETPFQYDFWYQPHYDIMVSSEFGAPRAFFKGFDPSKVASDYGSKLYVWSWKDRTLRQTLDLGPDGLIPLELRFAHDPRKNWGYVGCALSSNIIRLVAGPDGRVATDVVVRQPWLKVEGWALPELPPLVTDILLSLDDTRLFFSNWLRGDLVCYDISDPAAPRLAGRVWLGGSIARGGGVGVPSKDDLVALGLEDGRQPERPVVKGVTVQGGPQMIQLSLDGSRLYVTNSLLSPWDKQFYPDMVAKGGQMVRVDVAADGGLSLNPDFIVDFGAEPGGPVLAHEARYPGGDCSSDIWLAQDEA